MLPIQPQGHPLLLPVYNDKKVKTGWVGFQIFGENYISYMFYGEQLDELDTDGLKLWLVERVAPSQLMTYDITTISLVRHIEPPIEILNKMLEYFKDKQVADAIAMLEDQIKNYKE